MGVWATMGDTAGATLGGRGRLHLGAGGGGGGEEEGRWAVGGGGGRGGHSRCGQPQLLYRTLLYLVFCSHKSSQNGLDLRRGLSKGRRKLLGRKANCGSGPFPSDTWTQYFGQLYKMSCSYFKLLVACYVLSADFISSLFCFVFVN